MKGKKKIVISLFVLLLWQGKANFILAQGYYPIPDANFASYLQSIVPSAMNGNLLDTTSVFVTDSVKVINANSLNINSVDGVQYFKKLRYLWCVNNNISFIPALPNTIKNLNFTKNNVPVIPTLPFGIDSLACCSNSISVLPILPNTISVLFCCQNQISSVSNFPTNCVWIDLSSNQLTNIPELPPQLTYLVLSDNRLSTWPNMPNTITNLLIGNNEIKIVKNIPNRLVFLDLLHNPVECFLCKFPNSLEYINWGWTRSEIPTSCLPNYVPAMGSDTLLIPLCEPGQCGPPTSIRIPNVFTPNGDGTNDDFFISSNDLSNFNCKIFDRWGRLVAELPNATSAWNGKDQSNKDCDNGTYFYVITYTDEGKRTIIKKGSVSLFR